MRKLLYLLLFAGSCAFAQVKPAGAMELTDTGAVSTYNEELAKSLGADSHGMKSYVLVILKTGDKQEPDAKKRDALFKGHMDNITRMANEGKLALAGPFGKNDSNFRGIYIFNVRTIEEAKALVDTDPAVQSGIMKGEFYQWMGSAALMKVNEIHGTIAKEKF